MILIVLPVKNLLNLHVCIYGESFFLFKKKLLSIVFLVFLHNFPCISTRFRAAANSLIFPFSLSTIMHDFILSTFVKMHFTPPLHSINDFYILSLALSLTLSLSLSLSLWP